MKRGLDRTHAVYTLFASQKEMAKKEVRLPALAGYDWVPADTSTRDTVILKLSTNNI